jgi:hypothetical protein
VRSAIGQRVTARTARARQCQGRVLAGGRRVNSDARRLIARGVLDALLEDLVGELSGGEARESCRVPTINAKTLSAFPRADCGSSGARRTAMSSMITSTPSV